MRKFGKHWYMPVIGLLFLSIFPATYVILRIQQAELARTFLLDFQDAAVVTLSEGELKSLELDDKKLSDRLPADYPSIIKQTIFLRVTYQDRERYVVYYALSSNPNERPIMGDPRIYLSKAVYGALADLSTIRSQGDELLVNTINRPEDIVGISVRGQHVVGYQFYRDEDFTPIPVCYTGVKKEFPVAFKK